MSFNIWRLRKIFVLDLLFDFHKTTMVIIPINGLLHN
ncbi:hypothetical protein DFR66_106148 [Flavobacterium glaciei]|uniref:Uncharacterized protein n=1 Tax=Flavobacterium glaciei TaxID=386300 RepID=A0ABX9HXQ3_9FLAO|nr:hypothetical protein DFR66_106148 [Flavobacterium glaciei]